MMQPSSLYQSSFNDELIMAPSKGCLTMTDMWAMELGAVGGPLRLVARALPDPGPGELLVKVTACGVCRTDLHIVDGEVRSEEHTSELQSLMRISYAVFCLKKK